MYTVRISFGILDTKNAQKTAAKETRPLSSFKFTLLIRLAPFIPVSNQHLASRKRIYGVELFPLDRSALRFAFFVARSCMKCKAIRTLYRLAFAPARKPYQIGPLFTYKKGDFGAISVAYVKS